MTNIKIIGIKNIKIFRFRNKYIEIKVIDDNKAINVYVGICFKNQNIKVNSKIPVINVSISLCSIKLFNVVAEQKMKNVISAMTDVNLCNVSMRGIPAAR